MCVVEIFSEWLVPVLLIIIPFYGLVEKAKVYEIFIEGAKEGLDVVVRIFPSLLAMLVAIGVLRASGALNLLAQILMPFTQKIGMPEELVPLALIRPLSGSGALGIATELMKTYGADSFIGKMASAMYGSTETTFYVLAVYFGAVGIKNIRHSIVSGIFADIVAIISCVFYSRIFF
ncbi:MAG: hypothetical protein XD49_2187 [Caldanaerobacter subterraneus]|nr:MAG: hypothetical protein XD49_2187 [Caldanaerobacter subterraneus]